MFGLSSRNIQCGEIVIKTYFHTILVEAVQLDLKLVNCVCMHLEEKLTLPELKILNISNLDSAFLEYFKDDFTAVKFYAKLSQNC